MRLPCRVLLRSVLDKALTRMGCCAMLEAPKQTSRNRRLSRAPHAEKVLSAPPAIFRAPAGTVPSGRRVKIGGTVTSSIREDWRPCLCRGALQSHLFYPKKQTEVPHV